MTHTNAYAGNTYRLPKTAEEAAEICSSGVYEPSVAIGVVCIIFKILVAGTVLQVHASSSSNLFFGVEVLKSTRPSVR